MQIFVDEIARRTAENPVAPALISPYGSITYEELLDTIIKVSNLFDDRRLPRGSRVYMNIRDAELRFAVIVAALSYGLVPALAAPETLKRDFDYDFTIGAAALLRPDVPADIVIDEAVLTGKLADGKRRMFAEQDDDQLAMLSETTGTTGHPKLLASTKGSLAASFHARALLRVPAGARTMFAMGGVSRYAFNRTVATLSAGGATVSAPVDPLAALKMIELYQVIDLRTTPMGAVRMAEVMERDGIRVGSLKVLHVTGSLLRPDVLKRLEGVFTADITVGYGTSEASRLTNATVTSSTFRHGYVGEIEPGVKFVGVGTREAPAQMVIANGPQHQTQYVVGGRILLDDSPTIALPDMGFVEGNSVFLVGRADEVFNYSGNKIAFDAIQTAIEKITKVRDVGIALGAPIGLEDDLVVGVSAEAPLDLNALADRVLDAVGWAKAKARFHFFQPASIPRNQMGKVDRPALLRLYTQSTGAGNA